MNKKHEVHPVASLFPMMDDASFQALKEDIKTHGLREPIVFWKNMLVDGRNRLKACVELGLEADESELMDETDPVAWVISHNLHRRHLTTSQRSDVAAKIATLRRGEAGNGRKVDGSKDTSISEAASQMKVSPASVKRAKKVHAKGSEAVKQAMADGSLPVSTAAALVDSVPDKEQQTKLIENGVDTVKAAIKTIAKDDELVFRDVDDEPVPKKSAPKTKRAPAPKQDFGIELHEWLRRNTGNLQAYSEMINGLTGDWKEVLQLNHPVIWDEFVKAVCQLHASIENAQA
jgi:hypothetical protein